MVWIHYLFLIFKPIHFLFRGSTINLLSSCELTLIELWISWINYQFTFSFLNILWIYLKFREYTINSQSFSRIYYKSSDLIKNLVRIHWKFPKNHSKLSIFFANQLWTYSLFREFTINQRDVSRINYELTIFFANLL